MREKERARSVLAGAFTLLDALVRHQGEAGLTQLANSCSIPKSTAHRLLVQLTELDVVQRNENRYRVGTQAFRLGQSWRPYPRLLELAGTQLRWLSKATQASSVLAVPCDDHILIAAASLTTMKHDTLLRPGATVPQRAGHFSPTWQEKHGLIVTEASIRLPTGATVGKIAAAITVPPLPRMVSDAVVRTARVLSAALVNNPS
ncbi:helix-turn-helix domain-containing protein [Amycolatopsis japonica]